MESDQKCPRKKERAVGWAPQRARAECGAARRGAPRARRHRAAAARPWRLREPARRWGRLLLCPARRPEARWVVWGAEERGRTRGPRACSSLETAAVFALFLCAWRLLTAVASRARVEGGDAFLGRDVLFFAVVVAC